MQTLENWQQWKAKCALGLCDKTVKRELRGFVSAKFTHFVRMYTDSERAQAPAVSMMPAAEAWHRFETHFRLHHSPAGKSFKAWLFTRKNTRGYSVRETVEAGATLLVRDVVREYLRREYSDPRMVSYSEGTGGISPDDQPLSVVELLPCQSDTTMMVEERDLDELARMESLAAFAQLDRKQRVALLVHQAGLSLGHPMAIKAAKCSGATMYNAFRSTLAGIAALARSRYAREEPTVQATLACRIYEHVSGLAFAWGRSDIGVSKFCKRIEGLE